MVHLTNIVITFLRIRAIIFFIKVVSDLKFGHFYFSWPHLTSATSEARLVNVNALKNAIFN